MGADVAAGPKVTVVLPTYNREALVLRAIETVLAQTLQELELIVVDDGSTDDTAEVLDRFASDLRVTIVRQENAGPSAARNVGLDHAAGKFVAFIDSDNYWLPERLQTHISFLELHPEVDVVYGEEWIVGPGGERVAQSQGAGVSGCISEALLRNEVVNFNNATFRASLFRGGCRFDPSMRGGEDFDLLLRLSPVARFQYLPDPLVEYAVGHPRISDQAVTVREANLRSIERFLGQQGEAVPRDLGRKARAAAMVRYSTSLSGAGSHPAALAWACRSLLSDPASWLSWRAVARAAAKSVLRS